MSNAFRGTLSFHTQGMCQTEMVVAYLCSYGIVTFSSILESQTKSLCKLNKTKPTDNAFAVIPLAIWDGIAFS